MPPLKVGLNNIDPRSKPYKSSKSLLASELAFFIPSASNIFEISIRPSPQACLASETSFSDIGIFTSLFTKNSHIMIGEVTV